MYVAYFDPLSNHNIGGVVTFYQEAGADDVVVDIQLQGFGPHRQHALHIHEFGNLTGGCATTGKHFNPFGEPHGSVRYTQKRHAGDLVNNITSDAHGKVHLVFRDSLLSLDPRRKNCILGRSVVIHYMTDDYGLGGRISEYGLVPYDAMTLKQLTALATEQGVLKETGRTRNGIVRKLNEDSKTTGNAGGRMACAVIGLAS